MLLNEKFYRVAVPDTNNVYAGLGHAELYAFGMAFANVGHLAAHDVEDGNGLVVGSLHCDVEMTGEYNESAGLGSIVDAQERFEVGYEGGVLSDLELAGVVGVAVVPA